MFQSLCECNGRRSLCSSHRASRALQFSSPHRNAYAAQSRGPKSQAIARAQICFCRQPPREKGKQRTSPSCYVPPSTRQPARPSSKHVVREVFRRGTPAWWKSSSRCLELRVCRSHASPFHVISAIMRLFSRRVTSVTNRVETSKTPP